MVIGGGGGAASGSGLVDRCFIWRRARGGLWDGEDRVRGQGQGTEYGVLALVPGIELAQRVCDGGHLDGYKSQPGAVAALLPRRRRRRGASRRLGCGAARLREGVGGPGGMAAGLGRFSESPSARRLSRSRLLPCSTGSPILSLDRPGTRRDVMCNGVVVYEFNS